MVEIKQILNLTPLIKITELIIQIGINKEHIMKGLQAILDEKEVPIHILASKDIVLTEAFAQNTVLQKVKESVKETGKLVLQSIADIFGLPVQFIVELVMADH